MSPPVSSKVGMRGNAVPTCIFSSQTRLISVFYLDLTWICNTNVILHYAFLSLFRVFPRKKHCFQPWAETWEDWGRAPKFEVGVTAHASVPPIFGELVLKDELESTK